MICSRACRAAARSRGPQRASRERRRWCVRCKVPRAIRTVVAENLIRVMPDRARADALLAIADALDAGVVVFDASGLIRFANSRACALFHRERAAIEQTRLGDHFPFIDDELREIDGVVRDQRELSLADGTKLVVSFSITAARVGEETVSVVLVQDVTPRRKMQGERDLFLQLAAVGEAMPTVLHELRNPLAAVLSAIEVLSDERGDDTALRGELAIVENEVRRALLGIEGLGLGSRSLRSASDEDVGEAIRAVCHILAARARRNRIELDVQIEPLPRLFLDASAMRALVYNLVTNAIHACKSGAKVSVLARIEPATQDFVLVVEDTGSGMSPEVLARCTQLFFTTKRSGSGIGLALCRDLVMRGGAELDIVSAVGVGTRVRISVPVPDMAPRTGSSRDERRDNHS